MARRKLRSSDATSTQMIGSVAGGAVAAGVSSAGGTTVTTCPPGDTSFYCTFVKGFNILKMVLFILSILLLAYLFIKIVVMK